VLSKRMLDSVFKIKQLVLKVLEFNISVFNTIYSFTRTIF